MTPLGARNVSAVCGRMTPPAAARTNPFPLRLTTSSRCDWAWMCKHVAAVLHGIGARLDERPELLFLLRSVDQQDLIATAETGFHPTAHKTRGGGPVAAKVLDPGELSQIFGIEIAQAEAAPVSAARRKGPVRAHSARTPSRGRDRDAAAHIPSRKRNVAVAAATKLVTPAPAKQTAQAGPKTEARAPAWSAAKRAATPLG